MKNIQVIDGADNCVYDIFAATDEEFGLIFPPGQDVAFIDEVMARGPDDALDTAFSRIWSRRLRKSDAMGIHGVLFYELEKKRSYYPTRRDEDAENPDGTRLRAHATRAPYRPPIIADIDRTEMATVSVDQIEEFHRQLNSPGRTPEKYYRRNTAQYELVSYLAAIVALWTSRNFSVLHLFLGRASDALERLRSCLDDAYVEFVEAYLNVVALHLASSGGLSCDAKSALQRRLQDDS